MRSKFLPLLLVCSLTGAAQMPDSVITPASTQYRDLTLLKWILVGRNYRDLWALPVKMEVFDVRTERGGMKITELGGGQQTKSLRMKDKDSIEWVLRTVDKDVEKAMPKILRNTFAEALIQQMISAAHPYAPLTVASLAKDLNISAPDPRVVFVPDDPAFGEHRKLFANTVCMFERTEPTRDNSDTKSTETLLENLEEDPASRLNDTVLLKARLLDMLIADWDRHADQWEWGLRKTSGKEVYYPIPRDRDQAFFLAKGMLVKIVRPFTMRHMVGFTSGTDNLIKLSSKSWKLDRFLLRRLKGDDWQRVIASFQRTLHDARIEKAVRQLPPEVYARNGIEVEGKLKSRRDQLMRDGMAYYHFLQKEIKLEDIKKKELVREEK